MKEITYQLPKATQKENELSIEDIESNPEMIKDRIVQVVQTKEETITAGPTTGTSAV